MSYNEEIRLIMLMLLFGYGVIISTSFFFLLFG